jgi:hypothetical protein
MEDNYYLDEIRANYGHKIVDYRWIGLGRGPKFKIVSDQYDLVNKIYARGPESKKLGLADTYELSKYGWSEKKRRNLLYTARRHKMPRTPMPVEVTNLTNFSITLGPLGFFKLKRPITLPLKSAFLVRAGARNPQSIYLAYSVAKDSSNSTATFSDVQTDSSTFKQVQASDGNSLVP